MAEFNWARDASGEVLDVLSRGSRCLTREANALKMAEKKKQKQNLSPKIAAGRRHPYIF